MWKNCPLEILKRISTEYYKLKYDKVIDELNHFTGSFIYMTSLNITFFFDTFTEFILDSIR